ncbi:putative ABC transporter permease protein [Gordonia effusa NBRC 100432]|uniref:Putative ABC transporter permease protein n=1 Tax=Gordonia effusa NBRC 100432 TaxID=1077974 RepID=H0QYE0_9ACTN|nr:ABC transporter permease [Gordonia effusa]GAB17841.1 putative ABC transporter permease protein [Gordonia effusa NBRC 100432]
MNARSAIWLVAQREIVTRAKTRSFLITTALMMIVIVVGAIVLAVVTGGDEEKQRVGITGADTATIIETLPSVGDQLGVPIEVVRVDDAARARSQVADGGLDAAIIATSPKSFVAVSKNKIDAQLDGAIRSTIDSVSMTTALAARGVDAKSLPTITVTAEQTTPRKPDADQRIAIALIGTILLMIAIMTGGTMVAVGVVEEKTSRVVEILLATIKPLHLLWGKILGIGAIALAQVLILGATAVIAGKATGLLTLPGLVGGVFAAVLIWFILGFLFFATLYAATGALVSRQEELNSSSAPLTILAVAVVYSATFGINALDSTFIQTLSWIPPFSAALMPMRIATGDTNSFQIVGTLVLMIIACAVAAWTAAKIYQRSILRTGSRVKWVEALTSRG